MHDVEIRQAEVCDAVAVEACCFDAFSAYIPLIGRAPAPMGIDYKKAICEHTLFMAFYQNQLAGFALIVDGEEDFMLLDVLAVHPAYHGNGIGGALILYVEAYILAHGKQECRLCTNVKFTRTRSIYEHLGYELYDRKNEDGYDRVYYRKMIYPGDSF